MTTISRRTALTAPALLALPYAALARPSAPERAEAAANALVAAMDEIAANVGADGWVFALTDAASVSCGALYRNGPGRSDAILNLRDGALSIRWS